jgi:FlaA1/EpsC-like NDP-sugar epimerase
LLFNPSLIVVLDQAETLYEIELEMREKFPHIAFKFVLGDVSNSIEWNLVPDL